MKTLLITLVLMGSVAARVFAADCKDLPTASALQTELIAAPATFGPPVVGTHGGPVGGLFEGSRMWAAIVNRDGELCSFVTSTSDPAEVWPGSQAIAKAKAYTANAFSLGALALSSAMLYTFTQPGHSLWSLGQSNLFEPEFLAAPGQKGGAAGSKKIAGGLIFFGGGVPLYKNGIIVGGLGVSGDTSCADHEIAKRTRHLLGLDPPGGPLVDDIHYTAANGPDNFTHPLCIHTWRNSIFIGEEPPAAGY